MQTSPDPLGEDITICNFLALPEGLENLPYRDPTSKGGALISVRRRKAKEVFQQNGVKDKRWHDGKLGKTKTETKTLVV